MKFLISHGQAMRSVFGRSRVTHFISLLLSALGRRHDQELRPAGGAALEREVDEMRPRIDRDRMRVRREQGLTELLDTVPRLPEDGDDAALCSDVQPPQRRVEGEHVRTWAD